MNRSERLLNSITKILNEEEFEQDDKLTKALNKVPLKDNNNGDPDHHENAIAILRTVARHYAGTNAKGKDHYNKTGEVHLPKLGQLDALHHTNKSGEHGKILDDKAFHGYSAEEKYDDESGELKHTAVKLTPQGRKLGYNMIS